MDGAGAGRGRKDGPPDSYLVLFRRDRKMLLFPATAFADLAHQEQVANYARGQIR